MLRRVAREGKDVIATQDAARLNTPDWLWLRWCETFGEDGARAIADAHGRQPPVDIVRKTPESLAPEGKHLFGSVLRLADVSGIDALPGFRAKANGGCRTPPRPLPAGLLGDVRGARVIDLCAAPGGKTMQLAAMGATVTAVEARGGAPRARARESRAHRTGCGRWSRPTCATTGPTRPAPFVLLDAPCTATGTIRRHPELPWIKSASDVTLCEQAAGELLDAAAGMVAPGGVLVFAVCSLEPEEGVGQAENFLAATCASRAIP
ncbi:MAG: RsmB/NOP family class I SAM-dependent RNA methyltransferase [Rhizomicrobium sp.]